MKKSASKISVVVPVRNASGTLADCLAAVLDQTEKPHEVIVVENDSDRETRSVIDDFRKRYPDLLKVVHESIPGRASARNAGIARTQGDIIAMTDADCIAPKNWLERITHPIREEGESAVMGFEEPELENYWTRMRQKEDAEFAYSTFDGKYANHVDTKNFAIRADLMKRTMFDPELLAYEDWDLFLRLAKKGVKIRFLPDVIVRHRHNASFGELLKTQYARARGMERAFVAHWNDPSFRDHYKEDASARSHRFWNFIAFIPWSVWQLVTDPKKAAFRIVSDAAWKVGLVVESISIRFARFRIAIARRLLGIQMETPEILAVFRAIRPPMNLLVFGAGNDSLFWREENRNGRTVFLEDEEAWLDRIRKQCPALELYRVDYGTRVSDWRTLIDHPKKLELKLPAAIRETAWDVVLVDGPAGYAPQKPGRMKSIFEASRLAKPGGSVFIHDSEREVEKEYGEKYLGKESIVEEAVGRAVMRRYLRTLR